MIKSEFGPVARCLEYTYIGNGLCKFYSGHGPVDLPIGHRALEIRTQQ